MSDIKETDLAWVPPPFPAQGRLPTQVMQVGQSCHQQNSAERLYRQELCPPPGDGRPQKKAKSLWPEALDRESRTAPE